MEVVVNGRSRGGAKKGVDPLYGAVKENISDGRKVGGASKTKLAPTASTLGLDLPLVVLPFCSFSRISLSYTVFLML